MIGESFVIVILLCIIVFQEWQMNSAKKSADEKEKDLLNRIMARDYSQYVQGEVEVRKIEKKPLTDEEIYELQKDQGIPV